MTRACHGRDRITRVVAHQLHRATPMAGTWRLRCRLQAGRTRCTTHAALQLVTLQSVQHVLALQLVQGATVTQAHCEIRKIFVIVGHRGGGKG